MSVNGLNKPTREYLLSTNEYNKPTVLEGADAVAQIIVQIILLEPGTLRNHPELGVGLVSKYRYNFSENLTQLQTDIKNQIYTYLPEFEAVNVKITLKKSGELNLNIQIDSMVYAYELYVDENNNIVLDDLK